MFYIFFNQYSVFTEYQAKKPYKNLQYQPTTTVTSSGFCVIASAIIQKLYRELRSKSISFPWVLDTILHFKN